MLLKQKQRALFGDEITYYIDVDDFGHAGHDRQDTPLIRLCATFNHIFTPVLTEFLNKFGVFRQVAPSTGATHTRGRRNIHILATSKSKDLISRRPMSYSLQLLQSLLITSYAVHNNSNNNNDND